MGSKLSNEVTCLKDDNVYMKEEIKNLRSLLEASPKAFLLQTSKDQYILPEAVRFVDAANSQATLQVPLPAPSIKVKRPAGIPATATLAGLSYRDVAATGTLPQGSSSLPDCEGFQTVTYKKPKRCRQREKTKHAHMKIEINGNATKTNTN
jgi:hypothetical protein